MKLYEYIEKCQNEIGWDSDAEHEYQELLSLKQKFSEELEATKNLVQEGDPFTMTRQEYLDILENIGNTKSNIGEGVEK